VHCLTFLQLFLIYLNAQDKNNFEYQGNILFSLVFIGFLILIFGLVLYPRILYGIPLERESLTINANHPSVNEKGKIEKDYKAEIKKINDELKK
jgi:hypothetical protein